MKLLISIVLLAACPCLPAGAQGRDDAETVQVNRPHFLKVTLRDRVAEAMVHVQQNDHSYLLDLEHFEKPALLIDVLRPYTVSSDYSIRYATVITLESLKGKTSAQILMGLVNSRLPQTDDDAVHTLADMVSVSAQSKNELVEWQTASFQTDILAFAKKNPLIEDAIFLLSIFKSSNTIKTWLLEQREEATKSLFSTGVTELPKIRASVAYDIALAQLSDTAAISRLKTIVRRQRKEYVVYLLSSIKWIDNREVLALLVELLSDKRQAYVAGFEGSPESIRVCDIALDAFNKKLGVETNYNFPTSFPDDALNSAYRKLKTLYGPEPSPATGQ